MLFQFSALGVNNGRLYRERNNDISTIELIQIFQNTCRDITIPVHITDRFFFFFGKRMTKIYYLKFGILNSEIYTRFFGGK